MLEKVITLLFLSGDPIAIKKMAEFLKITPEEIMENIPFVKTKVEEIGLTLIVSNEGISLATQGSQSSLVEEWTKIELQGELTPAALQVLTLVAYLGYPTREQISYIRGVQSSQSIRTLAVRGLVARVGEICSLTADSLKYLGITKVEELPEYVTMHADLLEKLQSRNL
jgi:segregation and condensation protein B